MSFHLNTQGLGLRSNSCWSALHHTARPPNFCICVLKNFIKVSLQLHCSLPQVWFVRTCPGKVCNNILIIPVCCRVTLVTIRSWIRLMNPSFFAPPACERRSEHIPLCVEIPEPVSGLAWRENAWAEWEIPLCAAYKRGRGSQQLFTFPLLNLLELSLSPPRDLWTLLSLSRKKMALSQKSCALLLVVVAALCIQRHRGECKNSF